MPPRLWHWYYFTTREEGVAKSKRTDYYGESRVFFKSWCNACLAQKINELRQSDANSRANGQITRVRTQDELRKDAMVGSDAIPGRREGFEAHILSCKFIDPRAKQRVEQETGSTTIDQMFSGLTLDAPSDSKATPGDRLSASLASQLSPEQQRDFESDLCKLFIANGFAWHAVNHPETRKFFGTWTPGAKLPDRHKLSGPVLAREVSAAEASMKETISSRIATGMSDGWKNVNRNGLLASLVSVNYKTFTVRIHDLSAQRKTAATHLKKVLEDINFLEKEYNVQIIAWVSDAGGESRAMRVQLHRMRPWILVFDCWAHQINLIVADILRLTTELVQAADSAINIIKWMLNHSYLLGLLHEEQIRATGKTHTLCLPAITRWTSHFLSFTSLISESRPLRSLVTLHPEAFLNSAGRSPENIQHVKQIMANIEDTDFWRKLLELQRYLEPLAIAANVSQAATTRLDHILIQLGWLYFMFSRYALNPVVKQTTMGSIELRWSKADQDPFLLAVIVNPFVHDRLFNPSNPSLNRSSLYGIAKRVFRRLFRKDNDLELREALIDYLDGRNEFHQDRWDYEEVRALQERAGKPVNLVDIWEGLRARNSPNTGRQQLTHLAIHVLSIVANSAGCERLFSEMGNIQTKRRARLSNDKVFQTATVRMELKRKHAAAGLTRNRLRRSFGIPTQTAHDQATSLSETGADLHDEIAEELAEVDMAEDEAKVDNFATLAAKLRQDALDDEDPPEDELDNDTPALNERGGPLPKRLHLFFGTQNPIAIKDLFDYDAMAPEGQGLDSFRNVGLANLAKELEIYDLVTREMHVSILNDSLTNETLLPPNSSGSAGRDFLPSPSSGLDQGTNGSGNDRVQVTETQDETLGERHGTSTGPSDGRISREITPQYRGLEEGNASVVIGPASGKRSVIETLGTKPARNTEDHGRRYAVGQAPRGPTKKALLITADSSPAIDDNDRVEELDHTANDSERFEQCLKKLGFQPEKIRVVKAVRKEFLTEKLVMEGLDFLLSGAVNGDVLVLFVSTHAAGFHNGRYAYLKLLGARGSVSLVGTQILLEAMKSKLGDVRCTVEIVLDICHAAGLVKCEHVIRQMGPHDTDLDIKEGLSPSITPQFLITGQQYHNEVNLLASQADPGAQQPAIDTSLRLINDSVVQLSSPGKLITSDIFVWAAAKEGQKAYESSSCKNGTLVDAFCTAIETKGYLSRRELFNSYVSTTIEKENVAWAEQVAAQPADQQERLMIEFKPQYAQLLSNRNNVEQILDGTIFERLPGAEV